MNFKTFSLSTQENIFRDIDNASKEYPTLDELMKEQNIERKRPYSVHRRRDLDSLG